MEYKHKEMKVKHTIKPGVLEHGTQQNTAEHTKTTEPHKTKNNCNVSLNKLKHHFNTCNTFSSMLKLSFIADVNLLLSVILKNT